MGRVSRSSSILSELEIDVLNIGNNSQTTRHSTEQQTTTPNGIEISMGREYGHHNHQLSPYDVSSQNSDRSDEEDSVATFTLKKGRRSTDRESRKSLRHISSPPALARHGQERVKTAKEKRSRQLPTESLVFVAEQLEYSDSDDDSKGLHNKSLAS